MNKRRFSKQIGSRMRGTVIWSVGNGTSIQPSGHCTLKCVHGINKSRQLKIRSLTKFLNSKGHNSVETHSQLCETYRPRQWVKGKLSKAVVRLVWLVWLVRDLWSPPYSPDLVLNNYHLVRCLKNWLVPKSFETRENLKISVQNWLKSKATKFYTGDLKTFVSRYRKYFERRGDYVKK